MGLLTRTNDRAVTKRQAVAEPAPDDFTKVTVKFSPKTVDALISAAKLVHLNKTDTINRAVQLYEFVLSAVNGSDDGVLIVERDGKQERIKFL
ncbi:hypothetical protein [Actinoplanes sp. NPDC049265]|uniref:hypothetical protein n=1 Tax=Actinoplanes sp. NPDC049265 TaxID=3363902 RepID=UPI00371F3699